MQDRGIRCVIVPVRYRLSVLDTQMARLIALKEFRKRLATSGINLEQLFSSTESVFAWRFGCEVETLEGSQVNYVLVDKSDGHIWTKKESNTQIATEYYLELKTILSKKQVESYLLDSALALKLHFKHIDRSIEIDALSIKVREVNYGSRMQQRMGFDSNIRVDFCIPKFKKGYREGVITMLSIIKPLLAQPIDNAKLSSNFDDVNFIFFKDETHLKINSEWIEWSSSELDLLFTLE